MSDATDGRDDEVDTPVSNPATQDAPALAMHDTNDGERLDGLLAQMRADLVGENRATVEHALRQRLKQIGLQVDDAEFERIVDDLV